MVVLVNCGEAAVSGAVVRGHPGQNNRALFTFLVLIRSVGEGATAGEYAGADSNSGGDEGADANPGADSDSKWM